MFFTLGLVRIYWVMSGPKGVLELCGEFRYRVKKLFSNIFFIFTRNFEVEDLKCFMKPYY